MIERRGAQRRTEEKAIQFRDRRRLDRRIDIEMFKERIFAAKREMPSEGIRIVITGIGVVAPNGIGREEFWANLAKGVSGIRPISLFDTSSYPSKRAGEVADFEPGRYLEKKGLRTLDRSTLLLGVACKLAIEDSNFAITGTNTYDTGIVTGTTMGSVRSISEFDKTALIEGPSNVNPAFFPNTVINSPSSHVSIMADIRGLNATISSGFCSALDAAVYSCDSITLNKVSTIFVGSVEELCHQTFLGFHKAGCLSRGENGNGYAEESMPFDRRRNGLVLGEGAGFLVFEELDHAKARNAHIYGEVLGFGRAFDTAAPPGEYNPHAGGAVNAMNRALNSSSLEPHDIDLICSGANSSPAGDRMDAIAIKKVFGKRSSAIPVTAIKSMTGEGFGLSGSFQMMAALLAINEGVIPPTINCQEPDPKCGLDCVPNNSRVAKVTNVMINTFSSHGNNISLIIGRYSNNL